jgi:hypothetical protein
MHMVYLSIYKLKPPGIYTSDSIFKSYAILFDNLLPLIIIFSIYD